MRSPRPVNVSVDERSGGMNQIALPPNGNNDDPKWKAWRALLAASLSIPGARVDRAAFLRSQLAPYFPEPMVEKAIVERPAVAGIPKETIDRLADSCIRQPQ